MMRKEMLFTFFAFFLLSTTAITGVYAIEEGKHIVTLSEDISDITGDGKVENIQLKGVPYRGEDSFLEKIYIDVDGSNDKKYTIPLESGTKASLQLVDLNDDGVKDMFVNVLSDETDGNVFTFLYSLKDFETHTLPVPEPLEIESKFLNDYKAELTLTNTNKSYFFDLKDRKKYYKKLGLYYKGKLNEPTELTVNTYSSLIPISLDGNKKGLKGLQRVTGIANADSIALVESTWVFEKGQWKLLHSEVKKDLAQ
jgi:hypothetical protein